MTVEDIQFWADAYRNFVCGESSPHQPYLGRSREHLDVLRQLGVPVDQCVRCMAACEPDVIRQEL